MHADQVPLTFQQAFLLKAIDSERILNWRHPYSYRICGPIDSEILKRSIENLICRHDVLRMRIGGDLDRAWQYTGDRDFALGAVETQCVTDRDAAGIYLTRTISEASRAPVDLRKDRLFKARLVIVSDCECILLLELHHLIYDVHALGILLRDLWRVCLDQLAGRQSVVTGEVPQYSEYATRQQKDDASWHRYHARYWQDQRSKFSRLCWPREGCDPQSSIRRRATTFSFDRALTERLRAFAREERKPLSIVALAIYCVALSRISAMNEFFVPVNSLGRNNSAESRTVGYFAYVMYLGVRVVVGRAFRDQLERIYQDYQVASEHRDCGRVAASAMDVMPYGMFSWYPTSRGGYGASLEIELLKRHAIIVSTPAFDSGVDVAVPRALTFLLSTTFLEGKEGVLGRVDHLENEATAGSIESLVNEISSVATYDVI